MNAKKIPSSLVASPARRPFLSVILALIAFSAAPAQAMDTDIFMVQNSPGAAPNVLIVLDNTSNWSRQNQHWPGAIQQGQAEVAAIRTVIQNLPGSVNVGLLELPAKGNANDNGGYIRFAVSPMGKAQGATAITNRDNFSATLTTIYNDINGPTEKQNSGQPYGNLMYDAYNYFTGATPFATSAAVAETGHADSRGYQTNYTRFKSPLSADTTCANTYIIFIGNADSSGPADDNAANTAALNALAAGVPGGVGASPQLKLPLYTTTSQTLSDNLGFTSACTAALPTGKVTDSAYSTQCPNKPGKDDLYQSCAYSAVATTSTKADGSSCPAGRLRYSVLGNYTGYVVTPTETFGTDTGPWNADEWARFLHQTGVPVGNGDNRTYQTVSTYTIDVFNAQPNAEQTSLLGSMARAGGGKYFTATSQEAIVKALEAVFSEILAVNTTFASASLPISATNRSQNGNQVYIGMFRPDPTAHPRWFGNLKRYHLATFAGYTDLAYFDAAANKDVQAVNPSSGFITPCATSWWTADSGSYWYDTTNQQSRVFITDAHTPGKIWQSAGDNTEFARGLCGLTGIFSDLPDGPNVEKGGAAQMLRQQASRAMKTHAGGSLVDFDTSNVTTLSADTTVNDNIVNFIRGQDVTGEIAGIASAAARPSIHGDVVHSRPLPVDYGGETGVHVFYGGNDGAYRSVNATTGAENWSFVAPETYGTLQRLLDNTPRVQTPTPAPPGTTSIDGTVPKPFFFDGSTGLYQNADNSQVWIYPAMRRGGRMLYAFDVSTPTSPVFKWKVGCPNLANDTGCTSGMTGIGQTWSTPAVTFVAGYATTPSAPVIVVGGGYDGCEDADTASPSCSSPKGAKIYVLNAATGELLRAFDTTRSVASDITLVDINQDGTVDAAYATDTGGNVYRVDFSNPATSFSARAKDAWTITRVAYTNGAARKLLFAPAVLTYKNKVYLAFGSGDREHPLAASYPYTAPVTNRFYVYLDDPLRDTATNLDGDAMFNRSAATDATCASERILPNSTQTGWFMDISANGVGEQTVTSALIVGGMVTFSTNRPVVSANTCTNVLGEARGYWLNLLNGSGAIGVSGICGGARSSTYVGGGLPPSPVVGTVSIGGKVQTVVIGAVQRDPNATSSPVSGQQVRPPIASKRTRVYWKAPGDTR